MKFPSVIVAALVLAAVTFLQYVSGHLGAFSLPDAYAPLATLAITTVIKLIQEYGATANGATADDATPRGSVEAQPESLAARVLFK